MTTANVNPQQYVPRLAFERTRWPLNLISSGVPEPESQLKPPPSGNEFATRRTSGSGAAWRGGGDGGISGRTANTGIGDGLGRSALADALSLDPISLVVLGNGSNITSAMAASSTFAMTKVRRRIVNRRPPAMISASLYRLGEVAGLPEAQTGCVRRPRRLQPPGILCVLAGLRQGLGEKISPLQL